MGSSHSLLIPLHSASINTNDGKTFKLSYRALVDHVVLLRTVATHPEMTEPGEKLNHFIKDYCQRMGNREMITSNQQRQLPWQIDWIWHVHRLHPLAYYKDCTTQLPDGKVVDKKYLRLKIKKHRLHFPAGLSTSKSSTKKFIPSLDLVSAVVRQRDFLEKFKNHQLYTWNLCNITRNVFEQSVQNYVSFLKLAREGEMIVPTYDIDIIWHTHMRFPSFYQRMTQCLCGFFLDHDDSVDSGKLSTVYEKTADRWMKAYNVKYGHDVHIDNLRGKQYISSCAIIVASTVIHSCGGTSIDTGCESSGQDCSGCGGSCGGGDGGTGGCAGGGSSGGGSSCGGGGGGCGGGDSGGGGGCAGGGGDSGGGGGCAGGGGDSGGGGGCGGGGCGGGGCGGGGGD